MKLLDTPQPSFPQPESWLPDVSSDDDDKPITDYIKLEHKVRTTRCTHISIGDDEDSDAELFSDDEDILESGGVKISEDVKETKDINQNKSSPENTTSGRVYKIVCYIFL